MQIDIPLTVPQRQFIFSDKPHPAMVAGLGSGKTHAATIRFLHKILSDPGVNCLMAMPTYDLLKMRAIPGFEDALSRVGLPYKTNLSDYRIDITGYGSIYFRSYDRPERLVAFEVAHSVLDEIDTLPKEKATLVWRKVVERTRQKCKGGNTIAAVTTPDQGVNGFVYHRWGKDLKEGYELIKASTLSNPYLPPEYVEQIRANYDPILAQLYIDGEFVVLSANKVYHFFNRKTHHSDRVIKQGDQLHIGQDFNIGGCCSVTFVIDNGVPIAVDEFVSHDTHDLCNNIASRYKGYKVTVYPDASGSSKRTNATQTDIDIIKGQGIPVAVDNKNPLVRDRVNAFNALLAHDKILVNADKCPELAYALESQGYDKKGEPEKFSEHPNIDDWVDASGYFIHKRFPVKKPTAPPQFRMHN